MSGATTPDGGPDPVRPATDSVRAGRDPEPVHASGDPGPARPTGRSDPLRAPDGPQPVRTSTEPGSEPAGTGRSRRGRRRAESKAASSERRSGRRVDPRRIEAQANFVVRLLRRVLRIAHLALVVLVAFLALIGGGVSAALVAAGRVPWVLAVILFAVWLGLCLWALLRVGSMVSGLREPRHFLTEVLEALSRVGAVDRAETLIAALPPAPEDRRALPRAPAGPATVSSPAGTSGPGGVPPAPSAPVSPAGSVAGSSSPAGVSSPGGTRPASSAPLSPAGGRGPTTPESPSDTPPWGSAPEPGADRTYPAGTDRALPTGTSRTEAAPSAVNPVDRVEDPLAGTDRTGDAGVHPTGADPATDPRAGTGEPAHAVPTGVGPGPTGAEGTAAQAVDPPQEEDMAAVRRVRPLHLMGQVAMLFLMRREAMDSLRDLPAIAPFMPQALSLTRWALVAAGIATLVCPLLVLLVAAAS